MIDASLRGHLATATALVALVVAAGCAPEPSDGGGRQPEPVVVDKERAEPEKPPAEEGLAAEGPAAPKEGKAETPWPPPKATERQDERDRMVATIQAYGCRDKEVLEVMSSVPRHDFVPGEHRRRSYHDTPLPIGYGQTISQPYMVAEMTRLLDLPERARVLEVGTGSGYQAAVLAHLTPNVYTIEIVEPLAEAARKRLKRLDYDVVTVRHGDGYHGWPEKAPFDAIIVTCATGQIPPPLVKQLKPGGRMVIPVGGRFATQHLMLVEKSEDGSVRSRALMAVRFVPLLREDPSAK